MRVTWIVLLFFFSALASAQVFDVRTYGAKVDGVTDDYAALKAACAAAVAARGVVYIPAGTLYADFRSATNTKYIWLYGGVTIMGAGSGSVIKWPTPKPDNLIQWMFLVAEHDTAYFKNLSIVGPDSFSSVHELSGIRHLGGRGHLGLDSVSIRGFSGGVVMQGDGAASLVVQNSDFSECRLGILGGRIGEGNGKKVSITNTTFRDSPRNLTGKGYGLYITRSCDLTVTKSKFYNLLMYGVHLWNDEIDPAQGSHIITDCVFDSIGSTGILSGSLAGGPADVISNCTFQRTTSPIRIWEGDVNIDRCVFTQTRGNVWGMISQMATTPGNVTVSNCTFTLPATDPSCPGVRLNGAATSARWNITSSTFYGNSAATGSSSVSNYGCAIMNRTTNGIITVSGCRFYGTYTINYSSWASNQAAIVNQGGKVIVRDSYFDVVGNAVYSAPVSPYPVTTELYGNRVERATNFIELCGGNGLALNLYGDENYAGSGVEFHDIGMTAARNYQVSNRVGSGGTVASAGKIVLSRNYDTWRISGTTTINTIAMAGTYYAGEYGACKIYLTMDTTASISTAGNILPTTTTARKPREVVYLVYDTTLKKWRETTIPVPPAVPAEAPIDGASVPNDSIRCVWHSASPCVSKYWFEVSNDPLFVSGLSIDSTLTDTAKTVCSLTKTREYFWRVRGGNSSGWGPYSENRSFVVATYTQGPALPQDLPRGLELSHNYPNPFNPSTRIEFQIPEDTRVILEVFNSLGERVDVLQEGILPAGVHGVTFDAGGRLPSGVYLYRLGTSVGSLVRTMLLVK